MNSIRLGFFLLRYALFIIFSLLFRAYLLLFFIARPAGPFLLLAMTTMALLLSWPLMGPALAQLFDPFVVPWLQWAQRRPHNDGLRQFIELLAPIRTEGITILLLFGGYKLLTWLQWALLYILPAFPFPRRPMRPLLLWQPRPHRIERADCHLTVPRLPLRYWDGEMAALTSALKPELQALMESPAPADAPEPSERQPVKPVAKAKQPDTKPTAPKAPRARPVAPPLPPRHAAE